jgi:type IV secretion system protein VirD4
LPSDAFILGTPAAAAPPVGFAPAFHKPPGKGELITYAGHAHLATVAPTRSGKGVGVVIPNLLAYPGTTVVFDPKGEVYLVAARRRKELGPVYKLDPFGVVDETSDSLNCLDILALPHRDPESDLQTLAELFARGQSSAKEPFWDAWGGAMVFGVLGAAMIHEDPAKRNVPYALELLQSDDVVYNLAVVLDNVGKKLPPAAYREIASMLQQPDVTRGGVLATAQSYVKAFTSERVARTMRSTSFAIPDFVAGKPMTIFLIIPPERIAMFRPLLKLWVGTLLMAVFSRRRRPDRSTLFLLDEAAALQSFPLLEGMLTLGAGYGCTCWTIWQNLAQLQTWYPTSWKTILDNCAVLQAFGFYNRAMATQWAEYFDHNPQQLRAMAADEQLLSIHAQGEFRYRRINYLQHEAFQGLFDNNRFYSAPSKTTRGDEGPPGRS